MTKSIEDAIVIIKIMALNDPRIQYIIGTSQKKLRALKMNTCDNMFAQNKLLMQTMEKISKKIIKVFTQIYRNTRIFSYAKTNSFCESCIGDNPTGYCPPGEEEFNYLNTQRHTPYQGRTNDFQKGNKFQRHNNFSHVLRHDTEPYNKK